MHKGLLYLYAIIDVHSCYIVGWGLYSTLESENAIEVFERAIATYGVPEIINSDQGSQDTCKKNGLKRSRPIRSKSAWTVAAVAVTMPG